MTLANNRVNLMFKCPVGRSVPGGPYYADKVYAELGPEVYENDLIRSLINRGMVMVLSDIEGRTGTVLDPLSSETNKIIESLDEVLENIEQMAAEVMEISEKADEAFKALEQAINDMDTEAATAIVQGTAELAKKAKATAERAKKTTVTAKAKAKRR